MLKQDDDDRVFSSSDRMRSSWEPYTRTEVDALARTLGDTTGKTARETDPRIPRLLATIMKGFAEEPRRS